MTGVILRRSPKQEDAQSTSTKATLTALAQTTNPLTSGLTLPEHLDCYRGSLVNVSVNIAKCTVTQARFKGKWGVCYPVLWTKVL